MTLNDIIRWGWTLCTGFGLVFALWNMREVLIDNWALSESSQHDVDVLRLQARSAVWDHGLVLAALTANFVAGVSSFFALSLVALSALLLSAIFLIALSFTQTQRRRQLFDLLRLRRNKRGGPHAPEQ